MRIKTVKIKPGFMLRELGGEFVIGHMQDKNGSVDGMPSINETGVFLWNLLNHGASPIELVESLSKKNNVEFEEAEQDVGEFLAKLINGKIVDCT